MRPNLPVILVHQLIVQQEAISRKIVVRAKHVRLGTTLISMIWYPHSLTQSLTHSLTYPTHSLNQSLMHSLMSRVLNAQMDELHFSHIRLMVALTYLLTAVDWFMESLRMTKNLKVLTFLYSFIALLHYYWLTHFLIYQTIVVQEMSARVVDIGWVCSRLIRTNFSFP